jgi:hypothetical protein
MGNFACYVNISEYPHPDSWTPLDASIINIDVSEPNPSNSTPRTYSKNEIMDSTICKDDFPDCTNNE